MDAPNAPKQRRQRCIRLSTLWERIQHGASLAPITRSRAEVPVWRKIPIPPALSAAPSLARNHPRTPCIRQRHGLIFEGIGQQTPGYHYTLSYICSYISRSTSADARQDAAPCSGHAAIFLFHPRSALGFPAPFFKRSLGARSRGSGNGLLPCSVSD